MSYIGMDERYKKYGPEYEAQHKLALKMYNQASRCEAMAEQYERLVNYLKAELKYLDGVSHEKATSQLAELNKQAEEWYALYRVWYGEGDVAQRAYRVIEKSIDDEAERKRRQRAEKSAATREANKKRKESKESLIYI